MTDLQIEIRDMFESDIDSYCTLFQGVFSNYPWNEKWTVIKIKADIKKLMRKKGFFGMTAEAASGNIGYLTGFRLGAIPSVFYVDQLFLEIHYQGKKIGKRLLFETTNKLKSLGVSTIILLTKPNSIAEQFYKSNEYKRFLPAIHIKGKTIFYKNV
jgi:hypothetical protein